MCNEAFAKAAIKEKDVPRQFQNAYKKALIGKGYKPCVTAMCLECQGWEDGVQDAIAFCEAKTCPLYRVRPYQKRVLGG